ncbi:Uu.00g005890.m01.CDS01 [Anthostomella pinea]|uniref:Uu.00g005890.m01.CDS01 n=1 Tax=Anthostomella pinea TaxID=933095 RepID=A0AAI8VK60_9PEZI|nr:Uu.00g005890.m01.CDS01 [Anthostomella pinea]
MPSQTAPVPYFDRLPDEILQKILNHAMERDTPFFPEACAQMFKKRPRQLLSDRSGLWAAGWTGDALRNHAAMQLATGLPASQSVHFCDWLIINSTNRRFRRLGKESFFASKTFAMSPNLPGGLVSLLIFKDPLDCELALRYIRSIILVGVTTHTATNWLQLPKIMRTFSRLQETAVLLGYRKGEDVSLIIKAKRIDNPPELNQLLVDIGVDRCLVPGIMLCKDLEWMDYANDLVTNIYPSLRARAGIMARIRDSQIGTG